MLTRSFPYSLCLNRPVLTVISCDKVLAEGSPLTRQFQSLSLAAMQFSNIEEEKKEDQDVGSGLLGANSLIKVENQKE